MGNGKSTDRLGKYLTPLGAWALAFGCCVGWGAFVMPGTTFLPVAGPVGTVIGLVIGALLMLVLAANYHFMMNRSKGAGGAYGYASQTFGYDHGYLAGWFLILAYIVVFWGNATALPMIVRNLFGDVFQFGWHYSLFGYDVYLGEALLSLMIMACCALICLRPRLAVYLQILFAILLSAGVAVCSACVFFASR
ncbi:MAG: APC family permease, partial [bacterium]|nr:APC family permease [bacterium]